MQFNPSNKNEVGNMIKEIEDHTSKVHCLCLVGDDTVWSGSKNGKILIHDCKVFSLYF